MNRLSAIDAFNPAIARVTSMLFNPFRLGTWIKMGFIGLLGGAVATFSMNFNVPGTSRTELPHGEFPSDPMYEIQKALRSIHLANYIRLIEFVAVVVIVIALIFLYLNSRFRFVLFDSVISGEPAVGRGWRRYASQANRYFGFWLAFRLVTWAVMWLIVGEPLWHAYKNGVFSGDNSVGALFQVIGSIALGAIAAGAGFAIVSTLMKDFIMPIMALDDFQVGDAWSALWRVIASEPGAWMGYLGMKVVLAVGGRIALAIVGVIAMLPAFIVIGIPVAMFAVPGAVALKAGATAAAVVLFAIAAILALTGFCFLYLILAAPFSVFFPAYAFYFFGGRYPKLGALLSPQPPPPAPVPQIAGTQPVG